MTEEEVETFARDLCDSWYMTVDPTRPMMNAYDKISLRTQEHWKAQARLLFSQGWRKD